MRLPVWIPILALTVASLGCSTSRTASTVGQAVSVTVSAAGNTALKAATVGGKAAVTAVSSAGAMSKTAVSAVGSLAKGNVVTFVDKTTGMVKQLPWVDGLQLYSAAKSAKLDMAGQGIHIVRGSQVIETSWDTLKSGVQKLDLKPGDLVEMTRLTAR